VYVPVKKINPIHWRLCPRLPMEGREGKRNNRKEGERKEGGKGEDRKERDKFGPPFRDTPFYL